MNEHLAKALKELEDVQAENRPTPEEVMVAPDGTEWSGKITGGGDWTLTKHSSTSYTNHTRQHS